MQFPDFAAAFLARFPPGDLVFRFAVFDHARRDLPLPRRQPRRASSDAELLDQHDPVAPRVVGKHGDGVSAFHQFPLDFARPASVV